MFAGECGLKQQNPSNKSNSYLLINKSQTFWKWFQLEHVIFVGASINMSVLGVGKWTWCEHYARRSFTECF